MLEAFDGWPLFLFSIPGQGMAGFSQPLPEDVMIDA
jgi:hypothetical protein